jgi:HPt (histidine-containing phosphotransfer) domain-containing protein
MSHETGATPVFDLERALGSFDDDMGLLLEIAQMYLSEGPSRMEEIRVALKDSDALAVLQAAHRLRGSLGALGACLAADAAQALESLAADGDIHEIAGAVADLEREVERLRPVLEDLIKREGVG